MSTLSSAQTICFLTAFGDVSYLRIWSDFGSNLISFFYQYIFSGLACIFKVDFKCNLCFSKCLVKWHWFFGQDNFLSGLLSKSLHYHAFYLRSNFLKLVCIFSIKSLMWCLLTFDKNLDCRIEMLIAFGVGSPSLAIDSMWWFFTNVDGKMHYPP